MNVCEVQPPAELITAACGWGLKRLLPGFWVNTQISWPAGRFRTVPCTTTAWATWAGGVCRPGTVICTCTGPDGAGLSGVPVFVGGGAGRGAAPAHPAKTREAATPPATSRAIQTETARKIRPLVCVLVAAAAGASSIAGGAGRPGAPGSRGVRLGNVAPHRISPNPSISGAPKSSIFWASVVDTDSST